MNQRPPVLAWILLISLSLIWGSSFILIKKGLIGLSSMQVGSIRILSASLFLLPFALRRLRKFERKHIRYLVSVGLAGSFIPAFLFAIAQTRLESAVTGVLNALTPIFTVLVGLIFYGQKQKPQVFAGVFIGFMGTAVLIIAGSGGDVSDFNYYALLVVLATVFYAANLNLIKHHLSGLDALTITSVSLFFVGALAAVELFAFTDFIYRVRHVGATLPAVFYVTILGVVGTAIALILFNKLVQLTNPVFTSYVTYIIPLVAVAWGVLDGERLIFTHLIGMAAIIVGVYVANSSRKPPKPVR